MHTAIEKFQNKTYYADQTLVIDFLGNIAILEDSAVFFAYLPEHYLLITLKERDSISSLLEKFSAHIARFYKTYIHEFSARLSQYLTSSTWGQLDKETRLAIGYLFGEKTLVDAQHTLVDQYIALVKTKKQHKELYRWLYYDLTEKFANGIVGKIKQASFQKRIAVLMSQISIKTLPHSAFIKEQAQRLIDNPHTQPIFNYLMDHPRLKFIIGSDLKKFRITLGGASEQFLGISHTATDQTHAFYGGLKNTFPYFSVMGGIATDSEEILSDCLADQHHEISHPLIRIFAEEAFDFFLNYQKRGRPALAKKLQESESLLIKFDTLLAKQEKIIQLIFEDGQLTASEKKLWQQMQDLGRKIFDSAKPTPGAIYAKLSDEEAYLFRSGWLKSKEVVIDHAHFNLTFGQLIESIDDNCFANQEYQLALFHAAIPKTLAPKDIANLFASIHLYYKNQLESIAAYPAAYSKLQELMGKLFFFYVTYPGYIETYLPELHKLYTDLYLEKEPWESISFFNISCIPDGCVRTVIDQETSSYTSATMVQPIVESIVQPVLAGGLVPYHGYQTSLNSDLFDSGKWDEAPTLDFITRQPIYIYRVFKQGQEVGSAHFFKSPTFCRSDSGQHNVMQLNGVLTAFDLDELAKNTATVCTALPPSHSQALVSTAVRSAQHGAIKGAANVLGQVLSRHKFSDRFSQISRDTFYYAALFGLRSLQNYMASSEDLPVVEKIVTASSQAAAELGVIAGIELLGQAVKKTSHYAEQRGSKWTGKFFKAAEKTLPYAAYAYNTVTQGIDHTLMGIASGSLAQTTVEAIGSRLR